MRIGKMLHGAVIAHRLRGNSFRVFHREFHVAHEDIRARATKPRPLDRCHDYGSRWISPLFHRVLE